MTANTGLPYELITQQIFQWILSQDSARTIEVKHNVVLSGKTTSHQIDIYWEFEVGGIRYATVVQAKDWSTAIDQGELIKFKGVLDDLPGQPRGIVVTKTGYQRGAGEFARANGILLYELVRIPDPAPDPPIVVDYLSYARYRVLGIVDSSRLALEIVTFKPVFSDTKFHADGMWVREMQARFGPEVAREVLSTTLHGSPHEILLNDANGQQTGNLREVYAKLIKEMTDEGATQRDARTSFDRPTFLRTSSLEVPLLKIAEISTHIDIPETVHRRLGLPNFVEFVMKNLSDGATKHLRLPRAAVDAPPHKLAQPTPPTEPRG